MKIIADSSTTRTEWVLVDGDKVVERAFTSGMNPYFQTRREISHCIRLELPDSFFRRRWDHVHFYGAGCATADKSKVMSSSLVAQFKTPVTVESDLLGAARGLLVRQPGLACILGTGSNSCYYDGTRIVDNVSPLGYILGDEGSGAVLGKLLVGDLLKGQLPAELCEEFLRRSIDIQEPVKPTEELIRDLKAAGYKLYVLSNMSREFIDFLRRFPVYGLFDGEVVSCEEHTVKPEPQIYRILLERYGLDPAQTLFVDDRPCNIAAAEELGIRGQLFDAHHPETTCRTLRGMLR